MEHSHDQSPNHSEQHGLFYTYFGESGSAVAAFLYFLFLFGCIYSFLKWG
jgi:hypothetical protein